MVSVSKEKLLAQIDYSMGGLVAEQIIHDEAGSGRHNGISSECGKDLSKATDMARRSVREFGMFGEDGSSFISSQKDDTSEEYNAIIDHKVKEILDESYERVTKLLLSKRKDIILISKNLFWYDYLDEDDIKRLMKGKKIDRSHVREWEEKDKYLIKF